MVIGNLQKNAVNAQRVIREVVNRIAKNPPPSEAHEALKYAIITPLDKAPPATLEKAKPAHQEIPVNQLMTLKSVAVSSHGWSETLII